MKFAYRIAAIIYNVYTERRVDIPHIRTIMTLFGFGFLIYFILIMILDLPSQYLNPLGKQEDTKQITWIKSAIVYTPIVILLAVVFNKRKLEIISVNEKHVEKAKKLIPLIFVLLFITVIVLLIRAGIQRGLI